MEMARTKAFTLFPDPPDIPKHNGLSVHNNFKAHDGVWVAARHAATHQSGTVPAVTNIAPLQIPALGEQRPQTS